MRKRDTSKASKIDGSETKDEQNLKHDEGKFIFENGDSYVGEYKLDHERFVLFKQGKGVYRTDNFDVYDGEWDNDTFADSEIDIRYNNDARYRGKIDSNGRINGQGTYTFPDGSTIRADWFENKPFKNIVYREPLGFAWVVENVSKNVNESSMITFSSGNHFWNDMLTDQSIGNGIESAEEN
ncbi:radial spoke head 1 homolog isoform X1 [Hylaeus volcanicus]|uniref:radial spoke head 1 homolog isoform X1 n=1 Tax=Hylaeus volcanicus TaxID=313075 RepID=UPI0023B77466|nr:radial spoke head 1 homolog isoform X1 [Hylaeus volcanicus]